MDRRMGKHYCHQPLVGRWLYYRSTWFQPSSTSLVKPQPVQNWPGALCCESSPLAQNMWHLLQLWCWKTNYESHCERLPSDTVPRLSDGSTWRRRRCCQMAWHAWRTIGRRSCTVVSSNLELDLYSNHISDGVLSKHSHLHVQLP